MGLRDSANDVEPQADAVQSVRLLRLMDPASERIEDRLEVGFRNDRTFVVYCQDDGVALLGGSEPDLNVPPRRRPPSE